ncbi:Phospholipid-transporting ATPase ID [Tyrophagus putrescentiae]|nr:Phospholipid-transporting ATPase ID [Tyrophagus putrescentiae]
MDSVSFECTPFSHLYSINTNAATIHSSTSSTLSPVITTTTSTSTNSIRHTTNSRVAEVAAANYSLRWLFESEIARKKNYIKTSKYTLLTFLPLNLFVQFQRLANFYFLILLILQLIPIISSLTPVTTAVPLIFVLTLTAFKDAIDDIQKHRSDSQVNNRLSRVLRNGQLVEERWYKVEVGDVVLIENDNFVAADLLLLSTSEPNGLCYVETAELDGETNLKCRQALPETAELQNSIELLSQFKGEIICEAPNNNLTRFEGTLKWRNAKFSLDNEKMLLRGCRLRNTKWCFGVVIFAGRETKLMQNSGKTIFKQTSLDRLLNLLILGIVLFLIIMCLFCTIACGVWETLTGQYFRVYLPWDSIIPQSPASGAAVISVLVFFSYAIVLNTVVPISLYVSVEVIRFCHSLWINWDVKMYYEPTDTAAKARTTTLNEELGQIEYIFSDKTGTLTQNIMTFNKCSIVGVHYGDVLNERGEVVEVTEHTVPVDFSANAMYESSFRFYDQTLLDAVKRGVQPVHEFFRLLAICHTVMSEEKEGNLEYQAQSPDEAALTSAARNFGFVFKSRTPASITTEELGQQEEYELLAILDFNNVRKRMSVIIRKEGKITLYCKGADTMIFERMDPAQTALKEVTTEHLNKFASEGLRTLCLAKKDIDETFFEAWKGRLHEASTSLDNREDKVDACYEEIEQKLQLIGATAIEDKLQDGVPQTIANLALAGIKLWVLTGDKQETAINIGYSCQLLTDDMVDVFVIEGWEFEQVKAELTRCRETIANIATRSAANHDCSVITFQQTEDQQSQQHYGGGKNHVGDNNNNNGNRNEEGNGEFGVAHIGVGISGQEGMQAVLSSDFSIAQFRYLERLLLVHGRWSYFRMCKFLQYFFYKNFAFTLCNLWYAFFCGFSAQTLFDPAFISFYNVFYTSLPVLVLGIFDQDVDDVFSVRFPLLYTPGLIDLLFNKMVFLKSVAHGIITSFVLFFVSYGAFKNAVGPEGINLDGHQIFGTVVSTILVIVVTAQIALDTSYWTVFNHIVIWGSIAFYFALTLFINSNFINHQYLGCFRMTLSSGQFWFTLFIVLVILLFPVVAGRFYSLTVHPTLSDRCRMKQRFLRKKALTQTYDPYIRRKSSAYRSRRSIRSGYAFAHQEGFGQLITSGKIMKKAQIYNLHVPNASSGAGASSSSAHDSHQANQSSSSRTPRFYNQGGKSSSRVTPISYNNTPTSVEID